MLVRELVVRIKRMTVEQFPDSDASYTQEAILRRVDAAIILALTEVIDGEQLDFAGKETK